MQLDNRDLKKLYDILEASEKALAFVNGFSQTKFLKDSKTQWACERALEIIGEASRGLSEGARAQMKDVRWSSIIAQRNLLAHDYSHVDPSRIWETIQKELPALQKRLAKVSGIRGRVNEKNP